MEEEDLVNKRLDIINEVVRGTTMNIVIYRKREEKGMYRYMITTVTTRKVIYLKMREGERARNFVI